MVFRCSYSPAFAQGSLNDLVGIGSPLPMMVIIVLIMYFLVLRPQQKRAKEHRELVKNLRRVRYRGYLPGGLSGQGHQGWSTTSRSRSRSPEGVRVRQVRSMVTGVRAKGEPVKDDSSAS